MSWCFLCLCTPKFLVGNSGASVSPAGTFLLLVLFFLLLPLWVLSLLEPQHLSPLWPVSPPCSARFVV